MVLQKGKYNCITDVGDVKVGHVTLYEKIDDHDTICTGVTAILPHSGNLFKKKTNSNNDNSEPQKMGMLQRLAMKKLQSMSEKDRMKLMQMDESFLNRSVNEGFSGGEKKRNEIMQMAVLDPTLAVLDETDSGLDIDALREVAAGINKLRRPDNAMILITHYQRLLNYIVPDYVHVMDAGRIVMTGGNYGQYGVWKEFRDRFVPSEILPAALPPR